MRTSFPSRPKTSSREFVPFNTFAFRFPTIRFASAAGASANVRTKANAIRPNKDARVPDPIRAHKVAADLPVFQT